MKKTCVLLLAMLLSGALFYVTWSLPERESSLYKQEEVGSGQTVGQLPEQVISHKYDTMREEEEIC